MGKRARCWPRPKGLTLQRVSCSPRQTGQTVSTHGMGRANGSTMGNVLRTTDFHKQVSKAWSCWRNERALL